MKGFSDRGFTTDITCIIKCTEIAFNLPMVINITVTATPMLNGEISMADFATGHEEKTSAFSSFVEFSSTEMKKVLFWACTGLGGNSRLLESEGLYTLYCNCVTNRFSDMIINQEKYGRNGKPEVHRERAVKIGSLLEKSAGVASMGDPSEAVLQVLQ